MKTITHKEAELLGQQGKTIQGSCRGCIFGNLSENSDESLENCCEVGRLQSFNELAVEILNVQDIEDKDKNYKIINGRICNMLRNSVWKEIRKEKDGIVDKDELAKIAREELRIPCAFIVYCGTKDGMTDEEIIDELSATLVDIDKGEIPPKEIIIINDTTQISPFNFLTLVRRRVEKFNIKSKWIMEFIKRPEGYSSTNPENINQCIDLAFKNVKTPYYSFFYSGDSVNSDYLSNIDARLNDDLERFLAIIPENQAREMSGMIVQRLAHKQFYGNKNMSIIEKLNQLAEDQECKHLIKTK